MATDDERRHLAERLRHEARMCIHSVFLSPNAAFLLADLIDPDTTTDTTKSPELTTKCDRDALLALADEYEANARRIREACGMEEEDAD